MRIEACKIASQKLEPHKLKPDQQYGFSRHRLWASQHALNSDDIQTSSCDIAIFYIDDDDIAELHCWTIASEGVP